MTRIPNQARRAGLLLVALPAVVVAVLPLVYTVLRGTDQGWAAVWRYATSARTAELAGNTFLLLAAVTAASVALGTGTAFLLARTDLPGVPVLLPLLAMPLAIPSYVAAFSWLSHFPELAGFTGSWLVLTASNTPLVLLPVYAALRAADGGPEEVARSLGAGAVRTFGTVTVAQIRLPLLAGALLGALYVLNDYGAVAMMRYETFTKGIDYAYNASFDRTAANVISLVLVVIALVFAAGELVARGKVATRVGAGTARPASVRPLGVARLPALLAVTALVAVSVLMPLGGLLPWLTGPGTGTPEMTEVLAALRNTVGFSGTAALLTVLIALPVGIMAARSRGLFARAIELTAYAGYALPGISVGLALVYFGINTVPAWYGHGQLVVLAYIALFLPISIGATRAAVAASGPQLEEVARSLGSTGFTAAARVTVPLAAPGITAGAALVFLSCAKELPATLILQPAGQNTLALELWKHTEVVHYTQAAWYGLILVVVAVLPTIALQRVAGRTSARRSQGEDDAIPTVPPLSTGPVPIGPAAVAGPASDGPLEVAVSGRRVRSE
ncbi:ABC transporter permease [Nocardia rhizosphaerae]|uniref:ABC transporter permease n=1 Tax=Nocardia rhizosphaerae TaxID=1691571 RepID=A0ABV8KZJ0_9NOCA